MLMKIKQEICLFKISIFMEYFKAIKKNHKYYSIIAVFFNVLKIKRQKCRHRLWLELIVSFVCSFLKIKIYFVFVLLA